MTLPPEIDQSEGSKTHTQSLNILFSGLDWFPAGNAGGLDRYFYEELQAFSSEGHRGTAMVSSCEPVCTGGIDVRPMADRNASLFRRWRGAVRVAKQAFCQRVDVVNAHFALYAFPWLRDIPPDVPLIVNFQGPWADEMRAQSPGLKTRLFSLVAKRIELAVYRRAYRIITLSEAFCELLNRQYGIPLSRITVVPGAVHLKRYLEAPLRNVAREQLGWPADRTILLSVRRLAKRMGLDILLGAVQQVRQTNPDLLLLIGGKGPERENLESIIAARGLEESVRLLGYVPDERLPLAYAAADFSVIPSIALEGFGLTAVESLASGTPVLGTPVGGIPEILNGLDKNLVSSAANAESLAERIEAILDGRVTLPGRETCRAYAQQYGWPVVGPKILEIFRATIAEKQRNQPPDLRSGRRE